MDSLTYGEFRELEARYESGEASVKDLERLEPYRAKRAVLLASGFGSRMFPITINTPKPLVNVNGTKIIETLLDALIAIDVTEIYVVVGYLKECFAVLREKYPMLVLLENSIYDTTNNISSACVAREHFANAYVFESDLFLNNPRLIKKYRYRSCYMGVPVEQTDDWCFDVEDGRIIDLHKGGVDCYHMFGISYWTADDGVRLAQDLPTAFEHCEDNRQRFWDDVPCVLMRDRYQVEIVECGFDDVSEIDSFEELQQIDDRYRLLVE